MSYETESNPFRAFFAATKAGRVDLATEMVRSGKIGPWSTEHSDGVDLLFAALYDYHEEQDPLPLMALLRGGMDVNITRDDQWKATPLYYAVRRSAGMTEFLLMYGADPHHRLSDGENLIQAATDIVMPSCSTAETIAIVEILHSWGVRICRPWFERWRTNEVALAPFQPGDLDSNLVPALETTLAAAVDDSLPDDGIARYTCHFGTRPPPPEPPGPIGPFPEPPETAS